MSRSKESLDIYWPGLRVMQSLLTHNALRIKDNSRAQASSQRGIILHYSNSQAQPDTASFHLFFNLAMAYM